MKKRFTATVGKHNFDKTFNCDRLCLVDIKNDDEVFRDHAWIKFTSRLRHTSFGDRISFTADVIEYPSLDGDVKLGLKTIRNVEFA